MSRFFPRTIFSEDQPLSRTILGVHVLTRGATTGAIVGGSVSVLRDMLQRFRSSKPITSKTIVPHFSQTQGFLRAAGTGTTVGAGLLAVALVGRMLGREDIEWKDRSWRLLHNKGQVECDDFTYGGAIAGLGASTLTGTFRAAGWRALVGAAGVGSVVGTVGYMAWRYGVKGGKFDD
ncbi:hypothetical protein N0V82_006195 [Gnomoniopsis sp. IMI 355080]|nr:hypothetical protein N0V82_006195 [Gnomoniopsis sp. IMI 355080]